jgi:pyruvate/2-oxoglutarate dehydrogenase complex dihydrolipoamide acyltransferase (E2) component
MSEIVAKSNGSVELFVDSDKVTEWITSFGKATLTAANIAVSMPVGYDLAAATLKAANCNARVAGIADVLVKTGNSVKKGDIVARIGNGKNSDISAPVDGVAWVLVESGTKVEKGKSVVVVKTAASGIPDNTIRSWTKFLEVWNNWDNAEQGDLTLMDGRVLMTERLSELSALPHFASVWQTVWTRPQWILDASPEIWSNVLDAIAAPTTNRTIAQNEVRAILSGERAAEEAAKREVSDNESEDSDESDNESDDATKDGAKQDESDSESESESSDASKETDNVDVEALNRAKAVKNASTMAITCLDELAKYVGNRQDVPDDERKMIEASLPKLLKMDQSTLVALSRALLVNISQSVMSD